MSYSIEHFRNALLNSIQHGSTPLGPPGAGKYRPDDIRKLRWMVGVVDAMTTDERNDPDLAIDLEHRSRIGRGAGVDPTNVVSLVEQYWAMKRIFDEMARMTVQQRMAYVLWLNRNASS